MRPRLGMQKLVPAKRRFLFFFALKGMLFFDAIIMPYCPVICVGGFV
jgi:hypothetical protein